MVGNCAGKAKCVAVKRWWSNERPGIVAQYEKTWATFGFAFGRLAWKDPESGMSLVLLSELINSWIHALCPLRYIHFRSAMRILSILCWRREDSYLPQIQRARSFALLPLEINPLSLCQANFIDPVLVHDRLKNLSLKSKRVCIITLGQSHRCSNSHSRTTRDLGEGCCQGLGGT